jgi:predicted DNA-binding transcriptional regulator YafY
MYRPVTREVEIYAGNIPNIMRVQRVISLIQFLNQYRTKKEIASHLKISLRSVGRYINLLTQLGFKVDRMFGKYFKFKILNTAEFFNVG